jgi:hypothetical protein
MPKYFGRKRSGQMSVKMTSARTTMPPPPMPWIDLPTNIWAIPWAEAQTTVPRVNMNTETQRQMGRPKISLRDAMKGMKTALLSRYDVPIQKPDVASISRSTTML